MPLQSESNRKAFSKSELITAKPRKEYAGFLQLDSRSLNSYVTRIPPFLLGYSLVNRVGGSYNDLLEP